MTDEANKRLMTWMMIVTAVGILGALGLAVAGWVWPGAMVFIAAGAVVRVLSSRLTRSASPEADPLAAEDPSP